VGLQEDDIITSLNGIAIDEKNSYINILFRFNPGDQITVEFVRNSQTQTIELTLEETKLN